MGCVLHPEISTFLDDGAISFFSSGYSGYLSRDRMKNLNRKA